MAFLYYRRINGVLRNTGQSFSLAGYNLIYKLWESKGKPTDQGWHISADDMIREHTDGNETQKSGALIIDFDPNSKRRIGLIELLDIWIYTYSGAKKDVSGWSPMMLRFGDIMYEEYDYEIQEKDKNEMIDKISDPESREDFVEFLYLNGTDKGWNWGMNGMTNAAFIQGQARDYFRQYF